MEKSLSWREFIITRLIQSSGYSAVIFVLLIFFLNKGVNKPFEYVYAWMLTNIPLFLIFKTPLEKFSVLFVFLLTILLISVFNFVLSFYIFNFQFLV